MFSKKKKTKPRSKQSDRGGELNMFGIPGLEGNASTTDDADLEAELLALTGGVKQKDDIVDFDPDNDDDLEAELNAILGVKKRKKPPPPTQRTKASEQLQKSSIKPVSIKSSGSFDVDDEDDEDVDENDPELLNELKILTVGSESEEDEVEDNNDVEEVIPSQLEIINKRLALYKLAESEATKAKENARARRFNRGVKTLEKLQKRAAAGEVVPPDEIPPEISVSSNKPPTQTAPIPSPSTDGASSSTPSTALTDSGAEKNELSVSDVKNDMTTFEQPDEKQSMAQSPDGYEPESSPSAGVLPIPGSLPTPPPGNSIDTEEKFTDKKVVPPPIDTTNTPSDISQHPVASNDIDDHTKNVLLSRRNEYKSAALSAKKDNNMTLALDHVKKVKLLEALIQQHAEGQTIDASAIPSSPLARQSSGKTLTTAPVPPPPSTIQEALEQRFKYFSMLSKKGQNPEQAAKAEKCARLYQNAIALHSKNKKIPYEKLPTPPGYHPIPLGFSIS